MHKILLKMKKILPRVPRNFLFGRSKFANFEDLYRFSTIYPVILSNLGLKVPESCEYQLIYGKGQCINQFDMFELFDWYDIRQKSINQSLESVEIASWFKLKIKSRLSTMLKSKFSILVAEHGFSWKEIYHLILLIGFNEIGTSCENMQGIFINCPRYWSIDLTDYGPYYDGYQYERYKNMIDQDLSVIRPNDPISLKRFIKKFSCLSPEIFDFILSMQVCIPSGLDKCLLINHINEKWINFDMYVLGGKRHYLYWYHQDRYIHNNRKKNFEKILAASVMLLSGVEKGSGERINQSISNTTY